VIEVLHKIAAVFTAKYVSTVCIFYGATLFTALAADVLKRRCGKYV